MDTKTATPTKGEEIAEWIFKGALGRRSASSIACKVNDAIRDSQKELVEALESLRDEFLAGGAQWHPHEAKALHRANAALAKAHSGQGDV